MQISHQHGSREHCLLLVPAPSDRAIYEVFRSLASRWRSRLAGERLLIEGDLPLTPGLSAPSIPQTMLRLLDADCAMIDQMELRLEGLSVTYVRSGGHAPFRESYFDEVRLEAPVDALHSQEVRAIIESTFTSLPVVSHSATASFAEVIDHLDTSEITRDQPPGSTWRSSDVQ